MRDSVPVAAGLVIGIAFVVLFASFSSLLPVRHIANSGVSVSRDIYRLEGQCMPKQLDTGAINFKVREPSQNALPANYHLEAVDASRNSVVLYFANHPLCPFLGGTTGQLQNGTIVVVVIPSPEDIHNSLEFQEAELAYYNASGSETIADVRPIDVNEFKGVGWEPFVGGDIIRMNGTVMQESPVNMPGAIRFYHDIDNTLYSIYGMYSLDQLLQIAKSVEK